MPRAGFPSGRARFCGSTRPSVPAAAPHPGNAHLFIDYLLRPEVAAARMRRLPAALPNTAALALLDARTKSNRAMFPTGEERSRLFTISARAPTYAKALAAAWTEIRDGAGRGGGRP